MSIFNELGEKIKDSVNSTNLKVATRDSRTESEAIKMRVRNKMANLNVDKKNGSDYENLVKIHDQIEANHDEIYLRPKNGSSASQATEDCERILSNQKDLEIEFNLTFAELTADKNLFEETKKLQKDSRSHDGLSTEERSCGDINKKANEFADAAIDATTKAKENVEKLKETISLDHKNLGDKINDTAEDVKEDVKQKFKKPKPRP